MATIKQIEANRLNALKSTGPKTPEGKAAVRMNALRHGLRARTVVLPGENSDDFHQLCDDLETEWNPQSRTGQFYVEQMAISQWKLTRIELAEKSIVTQEVAAKIQIPLLERLYAVGFPSPWRQCRAQRVPTSGRTRGSFPRPCVFACARFFYYSAFSAPRWIVGTGGSPRYVCEQTNARSRKEVAMGLFI